MAVDCPLVLPRCSPRGHGTAEAVRLCQGALHLSKQIPALILSLPVHGALALQALLMCPRGMQPAVCNWRDPTGVHRVLRGWIRIEGDFLTRR